MYNSSDEDEGCEPSAFDVLMHPPSKKAKVDGVVDPIVIAVIYIRWLKWIDPSAPLYGCPYGGQAVRVGDSAEEVAAARWKEENSDAKRLNKRIGLMHELKLHGPEAFDNQIVEWKRGPRSEVQKWANEREIALIAEHGGPLRDPLARCRQTLNLTKGGKGNVNFDAIDALRTVSWLQFQDEMQEYVECNQTSIVAQSYVNPVSGYKLGARLSGVRQGELWKGHPDEANRKTWLESLPVWAWKARETEEWLEVHSDRAKAQWTNADEETRKGWIRKNSEAHSTPEAKAVASERGKAQWANANEETRTEWVRKNSKAHSTPEAKAAASERKRDFWANADEETRTELARKISEAKSTPESRAAASDRSTAMWANADDETRTEWCRRMSEARTKADEETRTEWSRKLSEAQNRPEVKAATSARKKKEWDNADEETLTEWARKNSEAHSTPEARTATSKRKKAEWATKRAAVLAALPESKRPQKQAEFDRNDLHYAKRIAMANALLQIPSYADKGLKWCKYNQAQAKKDGVVFFQNERGVWCARMGNQGGCAGSSAEHALTVAPEATVAA
jgi:hypothetical protein